MQFLARGMWQARLFWFKVVQGRLASLLFSLLNGAEPALSRPAIPRPVVAFSLRGQMLYWTTVPKIWQSRFYRPMVPAPSVSLLRLNLVSILKRMPR